VLVPVRIDEPDSGLCSVLGEHDLLQGIDVELHKIGGGG
jgi:hypothetical protein